MSANPDRRQLTASPAAAGSTSAIAGVGAMRYRVFVTYNVIGGSLWATFATVLGWGLGKRYPKLENYLTPAIVGIVAISLLPVAYELLKHRREIEEAVES